MHRAVLNAKTDVNEVGDQRLNALQYINNHLTVNEENGMEEVIKKLFERGIKIEEGGFNELKKISQMNEKSRKFIGLRHSNILKRNGVARINEKDDKGRTVLHYLGSIHNCNTICITKAMALLRNS